MSFMHFDAHTAAAGVIVDQVSLQGTLNAYSVGGSGPTIQIIFFNDPANNYGIRIYEQYMNPSTYFFNPTTNWANKPVSVNFDPADYELRFPECVGTAPFSQGSALFPNPVAWVNMGTQSWSIVWSLLYSSGSGYSTASFDIRHATLGFKNTVSSLYDGAPCMATTNDYNIALVATGFCDRRLKTNIEHVDTINGIRLYTWDWTDEALENNLTGPRFGVMAQEVIDDYPHAVKEVQGYYQVEHLDIFTDAESKRKLDEAGWEYAPDSPKNKDIF